MIMCVCLGIGEAIAGFFLILWGLIVSRKKVLVTNKPSFRKRHPMWGSCDICNSKNVLKIKGDREGLSLVCEICDE